MAYTLQLVLEFGTEFLEIINETRKRAKVTRWYHTELVNDQFLEMSSFGSRHSSLILISKNLNRVRQPKYVLLEPAGGNNPTCQLVPTLYFKTEMRHSSNECGVETICLLNKACPLPSSVLVM